MEYSRCYRVYLEETEKLGGFARVISDFSTTYYLCDVIVDRCWQHNGLGRALISYLENLPEYQSLKGILIMRDAHARYEKFGCQILDGRAMVKSLNC